MVFFISVHFNIPRFTFLERFHVHVLACLSKVTELFVYWTHISDLMYLGLVFKSPFLKVLHLFLESLSVILFYER